MSNEIGETYMNFKALTLGAIGSLMFAGTASAGEVFVYNQHSSSNFSVISNSRTVSNEAYVGGEMTRSVAQKYEVLDHQGSYAASRTASVNKEAYMGSSHSEVNTHQHGYINTYEHRVGAGTN
jgi:hypothetical protein